MALDSVKVAGKESCAIAECWKVLPLQPCLLRSGDGARCWRRVLEKVGNVRSEGVRNPGGLPRGVGGLVRRVWQDSPWDTVEGGLPRSLGWPAHRGRGPWCSQSEPKSEACGPAGSPLILQAAPRRASALQAGHGFEVRAVRRCRDPLLPPSSCHQPAAGKPGWGTGARARGGSTMAHLSHGLG